MSAKESLQEYKEPNLLMLRMNVKKSRRKEVNFIKFGKVIACPSPTFQSKVTDGKGKDDT